MTTDPTARDHLKRLADELELWIFDAEEEDIERAHARIDAARAYLATPEPVAAKQILMLKKELERERLRLAACGVAALADTPESAARARDILPDLLSASFNDVCRQIDELMRLRSLLTTPEPAAGPSDEEWEAIKERTWDQFRTVGYLGEQFIYDRDFDTALDGVRQALTRYGHQPPQPIPVSERLPGLEDCTDEGWCWFHTPRGSWVTAVLPVSSAYTHWLPHYALPLPKNAPRLACDP